jgi:hypothetical protein
MSPETYVFLLLFISYLIDTISNQGTLACESLNNDQQIVIFQSTTRKYPKMKTSIMKITGALIVAAVLLASRAYPVPITGSVGVGGAPILNNANIALATGFSDITGEIVTGLQSGSYIPIPTGLTAHVDLQAFNWTIPTYSSYLLQIIYPFPGSPITYRFVISGPIDTSYDSSLQTWNLGGTGTASITGFDDTPGIWRLTFSQAGDSIVFASVIGVAGPSLPDGGTTALLLGLGLVGMSLAVRRFKKA